MGYNSFISAVVIATIFNAILPAYASLSEYKFTTQFYVMIVLMIIAMKKSVILEIVYDLFRHIFRFRLSHSLMSWYQGRLCELRLLHIHLRKKKVFFCFFLYHKVHKTEFIYQTSLRVFSRSGTIDYSELCILKLSPQQMSLRDQYLWLEKLFLTVVFSTKYTGTLP